LRTLLHFFACSKNSTPLFSIVSALFSKKTGGWGYPERLPMGFGRPKSPFFLALQPVCRVSNYMG
jgi:hypothetical protein